jgi:hypothetical protein
MSTNLATTSEEPSERAVSGAPAWKKRYGFEFFPGYSAPIYVYKDLQGVSWTCPNCNQNAVLLRYRVSNERYTFCCTSCKWQERFNHVRAAQLLELLQADRP